MTGRERRAVGVIGGTGLDWLPGLDIRVEEAMETPYGVPSAPLRRGRYGDREMVFLARHGDAHQLPPHLINYRANLWALGQAGVGRVIAVAAVGGIADACVPGRLCIPDQLIDYTWGREHTFTDGSTPAVLHADFTTPYSEGLRQCLLESAKAIDLQIIDGGVYGATQGPRLETAAEIRRLRADGCDMVGMTGMPEAVLARELGIDYACVAVVVNRAAGLGGARGIHAEIEESLATGMAAVRRLLAEALRRL